MSFQKRDGDGAIFRNERKEAEQQPDYTGTLFLNGADWRVAGWIKSSKAGKKYLSLSVQADRFKDKHNKGTTVEEREAASADDFEPDSSIPF